MFSAVFLLAFLAVANASLLSKDGRIYGGRDAAIKDFPYQVQLLEYGNLLCGGSIISPEYVLTAAHCVVKSRKASLSIHAGSSYVGWGGSAHLVDEVLAHPKFDFVNTEYDIALLKVNVPFVVDEVRQPIEMFGPSEVALGGAQAVVTGWGQTEHGDAHLLQAVEVPIIEKSLCKQVIGLIGGGIKSGQICAGYLGVGEKDACHGDSGGPLAIGGRLAGVVSWGYGCASAKYPGVYTEVAHYRDWIKQNANL